ncbi:unnamed protein product [Dicrocoelium dendriticum]|nr:unnamed protein product [Dicrocoelium dendriticum]
MPAYSKLNKKRRVTCRFCNLPFGYVPLSAIPVEANLTFLYKMLQEKQQECSTDTNVNSYDEAEQAVKEMKDDLINTETHNQVVRTPKQFLSPTRITRVEEPNSVDSRKFLAIFLPDAINVIIKRRCNEVRENHRKQSSRYSSPECNLPYSFKFPGDDLHLMDTVICAGCGSTVGVRFDLHPSQVALPTSTWRSSRMARNDMKSESLDEPVHQDDVDNMDNTTNQTSNFISASETILHRAKEEGWISLSLECVDIEPLFGLVGLDQFSIRYQGGEMYPNFYCSIESSPLFSQNSATWMVPARRIKPRRAIDTSHVTHHLTNWDKTYYELERSDKLIPFTLGHGDLVEATVRRLDALYPPTRREADIDSD